MTKIKQGIILAKTEALSASFKASLKDYIKFFKGSTGAFLGVQKTYEPELGTVDDPSLRGATQVQTTVAEKLQWLEENQKEYIDCLFCQEKTNSMGATVKLVVDDVVIAENASALELLRLKSLLETQELKDMYALLPVRSDSEIWKKSQNENYIGREIYESNLISGVNKTTDKESYIIEDPNIGKNPAYNPTPQVGVKTTTRELGKYTSQKFTGETSQRERAEILARRQKLYIAVIAALKEVNDTEVTYSEITAEKLFGYLHRGKF